MSRKRATKYHKDTLGRLADPTFGFNGMLEYIAGVAHNAAKEAAKIGDRDLDRKYLWLRDRLDTLSAQARVKGI